jgi:putative salt-induced outer membrane protein YdiY
MDSKPINTRRLGLTCLALLMPLTAQAQDSDARNWDGEAELGVLVTTGNTEETNINSRLGLKHEVVKWRNTGEFRSAFAETEGTTTAEKYRAELESNYKFAERQYWFGRLFHEEDRFSGFEFQSSATTGYGNRVWQSGERSFLDLSVGAGYRFNKLEEPDASGSRDDDEAIGRIAGQYDQALSENALFRQTVSVEMGLDENETTTESETSLQANIVGDLSLKAAYLVQHLSDPPAGSESTDTELSVSLLYGF